MSYYWRLWQCWKRGGWALLQRIGAARAYQGTIFQSPWEIVPRSNRGWRLTWEPFQSPVPAAHTVMANWTWRAVLLGVGALLVALLPWKLVLWCPFLFGMATGTDTLTTAGAPNWTDVTASYSRTFFSGSPRYTGTKEQRITACNGDAAAFAAANPGPVWNLVPQSMLPFDPTRVTFNTVVQMLAEGGRAGTYDLRAYGAALDNVTDDAPAVQAAINNIPATGGTVFQRAGTACLLGATITAPTDRLVIVLGEGGTATNSGGLLSQGSVFRRKASFTTGPLFSQVALGATTPPYGLRMEGLVLDGNNVAGDLLVQTQMQNIYLNDVVFFNGNGNGCLWTGIFNSYINHCRFFELGNTTAFPNGTSALVLNSNSNANTADIWITQPHFESGRGSFMTSNDPTGTHPIDGVSIIGGKMEWSGNFSTGFAPPAASAIAMPFMIPNNGLNWLVYGMVMINGFNGAATHIRAQNCSGCRFYTNHETSTGLADNQLPTYFVDLFSGDHCYVSGIFTRGAQSGTSGAHIRVVESSMTGYQIDPGSQFLSPASGVAIKFTNPTTGKASFFPISGGIGDKLFALASVVSPAVNAQDGNFQTINVLTNIAVVIQAPTNPPGANQSQELQFEITNSSGGALTTAPTFAAGAGAFLLTAAAVNPANGQSVYYSFRWSAQRGRYMENGRTIAF